MKTRNGLVSNSSTSSFILVVTEKAHLKALSKFNDTEKKSTEQNNGRRCFCWYFYSFIW